MIINKSDKKSIRSAYGKTLVKLGREDKNIVVMDSDLACSTQTGIFAKEFPDRFFDSGIAEQDMIATAAGLASVGKIPFVSTFAVFATGRTYDQIRNSVCYPHFNVKIVATHGGITVGEDGASHQALEDIALMRNIPNMKVIVPADCKECEQAVDNDCQVCLYRIFRPRPHWLRHAGDSGKHQAGPPASTSPALLIERVYVCSRADIFTLASGHMAADGWWYVRLLIKDW